MAASTTVSLSVSPVPALYVGDLAGEVLNTDLFNHFSIVGPVASAHVCRDRETGRSLGYGYVNYVSVHHAMTALDQLNHSSLHGKPIRVMWCHRDNNARSSGVGNLFVKNLSNSIDNARLHEEFSKFGTILSCKVAIDEGGMSKGYGFVQFDSQESADLAIDELDGAVVEGKTICVTNFVKKSDREVLNPEVRYTNLYVKNLDEDITEGHIEMEFSAFGKISNVYIAKDDEGNSKGFGFVNFESFDSAKRAVEAMNGAQFGSKSLYVGRAQKKAERENMLRDMYEERKNEQIMKSMGSNVYIKNIDDAVDDDMLREHFVQYGDISSAKVMRDNKGISKGFGFVCYTTPEEAKKAVNTMHGCLFHGKPLYVAIAQRKEDRQARLRSQFARTTTVMTSSPVIPASYSTIYYGPPSVVSQRQGVMYPSYGIRPEWRPTGFASPSRSNFPPMPLTTIANSPRYHRQNWDHVHGHLSQNAESILYMSHVQQANYSANLLADNQQHSGHSKYFPNGHQHQANIRSTVTPSYSNAKITETLSSRLAAATPHQQKQILGEQLYPLVEKLKNGLAAKITGMLLEMDNSELLLLLESPEALVAKVEEAVHVLEISKIRMEE